MSAALSNGPKVRPLLISLSAFACIVNVLAGAAVGLATADRDWARVRRNAASHSRAAHVIQYVNSWRAAMNGAGRLYAICNAADLNRNSNLIATERI